MTDVNDKPRALLAAEAHINRFVELAEQLAGQRDAWLKDFVELTESVTVKVGEAIDLLTVGRPDDARALLVAMMAALDRVADPVKRSEGSK